LGYVHRAVVGSRKDAGGGSGKPPRWTSGNGCHNTRRSLSQESHQDVERARIGASREVPLEVVVNGRAVARREVEADGTFRDVRIEIPIERSSWVALRIDPSSHTNPIFVVVDGKPIRASRESAEWCLKGVDQCWSQKERAIRPEERPEARAAYDVAREAYRRILADAAADGT
jgi:hypothetical protein